VVRENPALLVLKELQELQDHRVHKELKVRKEK
jgi:hypothetical protein